MLYEVITDMRITEEKSHLRVPTGIVIPNFNTLGFSELINVLKSIKPITDGYTISSFLDEAEKYYNFIYSYLKNSKMINSTSKKCRIYIRNNFV